jgi:hypothetical protein
MLDINHDTLIPSYFNDNLILVHLALLLSPQIGGCHALEKLALDYLEYEEEETESDVDIEVLEVPPLSSIVLGRTRPQG